MRRVRVSFASRSRLVRAVRTTTDAHARFRRSSRRERRVCRASTRRNLRSSSARHPSARSSRDEGLLTVRDPLAHHTTVCDSPKSPSRAPTTTRARATDRSSRETSSSNERRDRDGRSVASIVAFGRVESVLAEAWRAREVETMTTMAHRCARARWSGTTPRRVGMPSTTGAIRRRGW